MNGIVAATTDPAVVKTIKNLAESSDVEDPATSGAKNDLTSDLANGKPPNIALTETSIPDSTSLGKDVGTQHLPEEHHHQIQTQMMVVEIQL